MAAVKLVSQKEIREDDVELLAAAGKPQSARPVVSQEVFLHLLRHERRRTERSGRPFLLVLINGEDVARGRGNFPAPAISRAIGSCIREIDLLGWYELPHTLGIIMPEVTDASAPVIESIARKLSNTLEASIDPEVYCQLRMIIRVYPADGEDRIFALDPSQKKFASRADAFLKRTIDVVGSALALLALAPLFLVAAVLIKCTSAGPVFYARKRLGKHGKEFSFYKFRTMYVNNDPHIHRDYVRKLITGSADPEENGGLYKLANDPRVTPIGRFLRRTSLDELPQFFNVLINDMSLVGPRPPLAYEYEHYSPWHKRRVLELKPGITGLWQVEGRSRTTFDEMVRMDIRYAEKRNLWLDLKIMLRTPAAMIGRGAC